MAGERLDNLEDPFRLYRCHTIMNCVSGLPEGAESRRIDREDEGIDGWSANFNSANERIVSRLYTMTNKRLAPRHRVLKAGTIAFGGAGIDCTVRNLSETGPRLKSQAWWVSQPISALFIQSETSTRKCRVVGRKLIGSA